MIPQFVLPFDDPGANLDRVGGKGASLTRLVAAGLPVPNGFHVTTDAYRVFVSSNRLGPMIEASMQSVDPGRPASVAEAAKRICQGFDGAPVPQEIEAAVVAAYRGLQGTHVAVAVRSSATAEDLPEASFAGQLDSYLNVIGEDQVVEAMKRCWSSLWTARAIGYRMKKDIGSAGVAVGVVIQELVDADAAGILFTANPLGGRVEQSLASASWGLGDAVVGGRVTPDKYVIEKKTGSVVSRTISSKEMMTVRVGGGTEDRPVPASRRSVPVLNENELAELNAIGNEIEELFGRPMDVEWALAGGSFAILQARPITALPAVGQLPPTEWKLPPGVYSAMRNNIVELMADPLTPLFETLGLDAVNASMDRILTSFLGSQDVLPDNPIIVVNHYAYYNGSVRFGPMLRIILDAPGILKRMFTGAVERWTEKGRPRYVESVETWRSRPWPTFSNQDLLEAVVQLEEAAIDAYGSMVSGIIPAAWMSEAWFTFVRRLVGRQDNPPAPAYLMGFDSVPIRAEKALYGLSAWVQDHAALTRYLAATTTADLVLRLGAPGAPEGVPAHVWDEWRERWQAYLSEFGHMIYNLDFSNPVLSDDPTPALDTLNLFLEGQGTDPHARQAQAVSRREAAIQAMEKQLEGLRLRLFRRSLARAQKYAPLRENALADVGLSYPLLRQMLLTLGGRLVEAGVIDDESDIFWLNRGEVEAAAERLDRGELRAGRRDDTIAQRKAIWLAARKATPPVMLPRLKIFGAKQAWLKWWRKKTPSGRTLKGVGASPGNVVGPARVVHGPEEFDRMTSGDILVAPLTTPAWTPLFARAAGIVTDVGGPLSHGSIVAREYGVPAVLGTGEATSQIANGQLVTVNGDAGLVTLHKRT